MERLRTSSLISLGRLAAAGDIESHDAAASKGTSGLRDLCAMLAIVCATLFRLLVWTMYRKMGSQEEANKG